MKIKAISNPKRTGNFYSYREVIRAGPSDDADNGKSSQIVRYLWRNGELIGGPDPIASVKWPSDADKAFLMAAVRTWAKDHPEVR